MSLQFPSLPPARQNERAFIPATGGEPLLRWIGLDVDTQRFYLQDESGVDMTDFLPRSQKVLWPGFDVAQDNLRAGNYSYELPDGSADEVIWDTAANVAEDVRTVLEKVGGVLLALPAKIVRVPVEIAQQGGALIAALSAAAMQTIKDSVTRATAAVPLGIIALPIGLYIAWKLFGPSKAAPKPKAA